MYDTSGGYGEAAWAVNSAVCQEQGFDTALTLALGAFLSLVEALCCRVWVLLW